MAILIDHQPRVLVQGITGKEGGRAAAAMRAYGTEVVCGVTPGKGGQVADLPAGKAGGVPVYNTVAEALAVHPGVQVSAVYVPPKFAKAAILEAVSAGIPLVHVVTERMPIRDVAECLAAARERGVRILGPASVGIIAPGRGRIGMIGGDDPSRIYTPGPIGVISRSGGMTNEVSWMLRRAGLGQSASVAIGGDYLIGTAYADLLAMFEADSETKGVIIFGEVGGLYEFEIIDMIRSRRYTKPLAIYIGGRFGKNLPAGTPIGHAGALIERGRGTVEEKEEALRSVGVHIAERYEDLPSLIQTACNL